MRIIFDLSCRPKGSLTHPADSPPLPTRACASLAHAHTDLPLFAALAARVSPANQSRSIPVQFFRVYWACLTRCEKTLPCKRPNGAFGCPASTGSNLVGVPWAGGARNWPAAGRGLPRQDSKADLVRREAYRAQEAKC